MTFASSWQDYSFIGLPKPSFPTFRKALSGVYDHFIPHERNNYHPHILSQRFLGLLSLLMVAMKFAVIALVALSPAATTYSSAITTDNVFNLTNESRAAYQLPALTQNSKLAIAAQNKANDMAAKGYFSHTTPDGHSPWWFIQNAGYSYITAGENLAVDFTQAENIETAWMNSPGHRANILNKNYQEIGIGIASGKFQGHDTTFVVQEFGTPSAQQITFQNQPTHVQAPSSAPAAAPTPAVTPAAPANVATVPASPTPTAEVQIVDTTTEVQGDQLLISVMTAGPVASIIAHYNDGGAMLYPKSETSWQGTVPLSALSGETNLSLTAADIRGHVAQAAVASFTPSLQSNYHFLGAVKGATVTILGATIDPKAFEQKFYLVLIAGLLACMIMAIAIKRHIQHLSLVANSSFVVVLATLLWMAG